MTHDTANMDGQRQKKRVKRGRQRGACREHKGEGSGSKSGAGKGSGRGAARACKQAAHFKKCFGLKVFYAFWRCLCLICCHKYARSWLATRHITDTPRTTRPPPPLLLYTPQPATNTYVFVHLVALLRPRSIGLNHALIFNAVQIGEGEIEKRRERAGQLKNREKDGRKKKRCSEKKHQGKCCLKSV